MRHWVTKNYSKKKIRGLKRRCRTFLKYISEQTDSLPMPKNNDLSYPGYSSLLLRFEEFFTNSKKTPNSVRKLFVQTVIDRIQHLIEIRTESQVEYRIFCTFYLPNLVGAQITVLFLKKGLESFYEGLFSREVEGLRLISLHEEQNFDKEWGLHIPKGLDVKGYKAEEDDEVNFPSDEIWLIGALD